MESVTLLTNLKPKEKNPLHIHHEGINLMFISSKCFEFSHMEQAHHRIMSKLRLHKHSVLAIHDKMLYNLLCVTRQMIS